MSTITNYPSYLEVNIDGKITTFTKPYSCVADTEQDIILRDLFLNQVLVYLPDLEGWEYTDVYDLQAQIMALNVVDSSDFYEFIGNVTQAGSSDVQQITSGSTTKGVTYLINNSGDSDYTICGAPNNDTGTMFIGNGEEPVWGSSGELKYDNGAPVINVLKNTLGNVWFTYSDVGLYNVNNSLYSLYNSSTIIQNGGDFSQMYDIKGDITIGSDPENPSNLRIITYDSENNLTNDILKNTTIHIRVKK